MRIGDFDLYKELLQKTSGLHLTPEDAYLLVSRLTPIARKWGYPSLNALTLSLRGVPSPDLIQDIVEAMTFKDTAFFYETPSCEAFRNAVLPYLAKKRGKNKPVYFWSSTCATGQEAYSIAMSIAESEDIQPSRAKFLATDICGAYLAEAQKGTYSQVEMQRGLPVQMLLKHAQQDGKYWQINKEICDMISFNPFNLLDDMTPLGMFDVIFCRNTLPSLEEGIRSDVLKRLAECLAPDGFLFISENETLPQSTGFRALPAYSGLYIHEDSKLKEDELAKIAAR